MADVIEKEETALSDLATQAPVPSTELREINDEQAAAILLLLFSEKEAADILSRLEPKEVEQLSSIMYSVSDIGPGEIDTVLDRFVNRAKHRTTLGYRSDVQIQSMLTAALGEQRAEVMISRTAPKRPQPSLEALEWMSPSDIVSMLEDEHPQMIALVLSFLSADNAAAVLGDFPADLQDDIVYRLATLGQVSSDAIDTIEQLLTAFHAPKGSGGRLIDNPSGARINTGFSLATNPLNKTTDAAANNRATPPKINTSLTSKSEPPIKNGTRKNPQKTRLPKKQSISFNEDCFNVVVLFVSIFFMRRPYMTGSP